MPSRSVLPTHQRLVGLRDGVEVVFRRPQPLEGRPAQHRHQILVLQHQHLHKRQAQDNQRFILSFSSGTSTTGSRWAGPTSTNEALLAPTRCLLLNSICVHHIRRKTGQHQRRHGHGAHMAARRKGHYTTPLFGEHVPSLATGFGLMSIWLLARGSACHPTCTSPK